MARFREVQAEEGDLDMVQAVLDYAQIKHNGRDIRIGILGLDADNNLCYLDGRVEYDRDDDYDTASNPPVQYCGFARNFLSPTKTTTTTTTYKPRRRRQSQDPPFVVPHVQPVSTENHARNVSKLLEEEEKSKEKAERKRLKKVRQRERKRQAKLEKEMKNPNKNVEAACRAGGEGANVSRQAACRAGGEGVTGERRTPRDSDSSDSTDEDSSEDEESDRESISGNSEELDLTSTFVSKAAVIAKRQLEQMPKSERRSERKNSPVSPPPPASRAKEKPNAGYIEFKKTDSSTDSSSSEDVIKISNDLAVTGNKFASAGHFAMAVKYFTDAIKYNPIEYRLFGNRSFCFEKMQEYERALTDAELSLNMCPGWVKGLYRKGRALAGLQRYEEAAQALKEVLQLDSSCTDAAQELMRVQITQLMEFGFSREQSSNALIIHGTVQKALEALSKISGVPVLKKGSYPTANPTLPARTANGNPTLPAQKASGNPTSPAQTASGNPTVPARTASANPTIPARTASANPTIPARTASTNPTVPARTASTNPTVPARTASGNPTVPARTASASRTCTAASSLPPRFQAQAAQAAKPLQTQAQNAPKTQTPTKPTPRQPNSLAKTKPDKPQAQPDLFPIWVGNMAHTVSEPVLQDLFGSVGEVHSVKLLRIKRCAFVNFTNQHHCDAAIQKFHGHELHAARITVRYPDRMPNHLGISKSALQAVDMPENANGNLRECFFWKNFGCNRPACPFRHIPEHKGIDRRRTSEQ